jgi:hypothetical protein
VFLLSNTICTPIAIQQHLINGVSLGCTGWPQIHNLSASDCQVPGLQSCATMPSEYILFNHFHLENVRINYIHTYLHIYKHVHTYKNICIYAHLLYMLILHMYKASFIKICLYTSYNLKIFT